MSHCEEFFESQFPITIFIKCFRLQGNGCRNIKGEQEIVSITIEESVPRERIGSLVMNAMNRALKKAQVVAAERMQGIMQQMGIPTGAGEEER